MANTLPDLQILSNLAIAALDKKAPTISAFTTDLSADIADAGATVQTYYMAAQTCSIWDSTNGFSPADKTLTKVTVTMQEPLYNTFYQSPNQASSYTEQQMAGVVAPIMNGMVDEILIQIARAAYTATNAVGNGYSGSATSFGFDELESAAATVLSSGSADCVALLNSKLHFGLRKDLTGLYGGSDYAINGNPWGGTQVGVTTVYPFYAFPKIVGGLAGIVGTKDSVVIATRVPSVGPNVERAMVTHAQTGLTFAIDRWFDATRGMWITCPKLSYGVIAGRPAASVRLFDTDNP